MAIQRQISTKSLSLCDRQEHFSGQANWKYVIEVFQFWFTHFQDQVRLYLLSITLVGDVAPFTCQRSLQIGCLLLLAQSRRSPPDAWRQSSCFSPLSIFPLSRYIVLTDLELKRSCFGIFGLLEQYHKPWHIGLSPHLYQVQKLTCRFFVQSACQECSRPRAGSASSCSLQLGSQISAL